MSYPINDQIQSLGLDPEAERYALQWHLDDTDRRRMRTLLASALPHDRRKFTSGILCDAKRQNGIITLIFRHKRKGAPSEKQIRRLLHFADGYTQHGKIQALANLRTVTLIPTEKNHENRRPENPC